MNTATNIIQFPNPLEQYREVVSELKALEKGSDVVTYGNLKAEKSKTSWGTGSRRSQPRPKSSD